MEGVKAKLAQRPDLVTQADPIRDMTPLYWAVGLMRLEMVKLLVEEHKAPVRCGTWVKGLGKGG